MNIRHNGRVIESLESINSGDVIHRVNETINFIQENEQVVTEIFINGQDVTGVFDLYISENLISLKEIDIQSVSTRAMFEQLLQDTFEYVKKVYNATDSISDLFYGNPDREAWIYFTQLTEGIQYTAQSVQVLATHLERSGNDEEMLNVFRVFLQRLKELLGDIQQALESQDNVFIADLIKYEVGDLAKQLLEALESKVNT